MTDPDPLKPYVDECRTLSRKLREQAARYNDGEAFPMPFIAKLLLAASCVAWIILAAAAIRWAI